ncbi:MAG TPA: TolC family protein [Polyangiaceae bacterium]|nr:TolC family protein [Polyangiaceae bacterium]
MACARCLVLSTAAGLAIARTAYAEPIAQGEPPSIDAPAPTRTMALGEAVAYARAHQPAIRAAMARVEERLAQAKVPSGRWMPTVALTGQAFAGTTNNTTALYVQPNFLDVPRIGATAATRTGTFSPSPSTLVGAGITQEVFDFGRIGARRAAADAAVEVERHHADAVRLDRDLSVEEAYFSVLAARAVVKASDDAYERSRVHRDFARRGVESGLRSPIELTRAEADLARFDVGRVRARGGLAVAQSVLAAAIGAPDPAVDAAATPPSAAEMPALGEAVALAQRRDPRLAETIARLHEAEEHTRAVGAELRPDLSLTATLSGRAGGASPSSGAVADGGGWIPDVPNWDAGVLLSWPLFDGTIAARRDAARSAERVAHEEIDAALLQDVADVRQSYVAVQIARSALIALERTVVAARANYEQADARFRAGIGNAVEVADAEAVRTDADIQLALGQFELARARAAFGRSIAETL